MRVQDIIVKKPYLAWDVHNPDRLSDEATLEHILNFGNWDDVQRYIKIKSLTKTAQIFKNLIHKSRTNLFPEIQDYFIRYFQKHA